ncbi:MAG: 30S ribosomal protein S8 [Candidatus Marsarchaeota archaeon]|nr:30S ribosomal protein S8 [Candidatus Marsarchaeota archaeon]
MVDRVSDAINTIKTHENVGREECTVQYTKFIKAILDVMKKESYIGDFEEVSDGKFKKLKIKLVRRINDIGTIKPRTAVTTNEIQKYETRYIPSKDFGVLIMSTSQGMMTNREAKEKGIGGRLVAYVY